MKTKTALTLLLLFIFMVMQASGQLPSRKKVTATRISTPLKIDGLLDEAVYQQGEKCTDFMQLMPYNGQPSFKPTEVSIFYDDNALYVGAMLFDDPDSIQSYISTRDNLGISDYFDFFIDPNNEGLTGYEFAVTPANSQCDLKAIKNSDGDNEDSSWDAVWQSATQINENGWSVEFRIPYSALRFPAKEESVWGINFFRRIRRYNSNNSWNLIHSEISGFIQQSGELYGLKNIKAPVRLSVTPYVATYAEHNSPDNEMNYYFKGGIDLKYGLSESHTLDMMLIPDFGQIQSDDEQLNLSPYEIYYDEKRQFFVEGVELFNRVGIFYSRRIGTTPKFSNTDNFNLKENEKVTYNPSETQLINATKISGRDKNGWGVGFLNAMSLPAKATVTDTITGDKREIVTQPFTNYNVSVIEKAMKNNSYFSLINTNLAMVNNPYLANVTGTEFQLKNKKQTYQLTGAAAISYRSAASDKTGFGYKLGVKKVKGKFRFQVNHDAINSKFDPNDMGYIQRNNEISDDAQVSYNIYDPFWKIFKNWYGHIRVENTMLYSPSKEIENQIRLWTEATFKNNWWAGLFFGHSFGTRDYYETRVENRYYKGPRYDMYEIDFHTDTDKRLSWNLCAGAYISEENSTWGYWSYNNLAWKASQRINFSYSVTANKDFRNYGYVNDYRRDSVFFGGFDRMTLINTLSMSYTFNTKAKVDFRGRHYWSWADYDSYYFLHTNGSLENFNYTDNANINFNAFNIDMSFRWEFAPGSELSLVWKNSIYTENKETDQSFGKNFAHTLRSDQRNSLSLKVLYYIDYNSLRKKV